jgi:hypothetical protein
MLKEDWPVRVEVDDPNITAIWPLSSYVEIIEDLPDGGAMVHANLPSGMRVGRISAETLAERNDWKLNIRTRVRRMLIAE